VVNFTVRAEDVPHRLRLSLVDHQFAVVDVVSEWQRSAHPHAPTFGSCYLVADTFAGDLPLELRERQKHVQRQPADRRGCIEVLGNGDERDTPGVEDLDQLGEVSREDGWSFL
jgi:hypothetical protein